MLSLRERLARTPPGYRLSIGRILAIYAGLMVTLMLAALDQTIVATALPTIVSDLGGLSQYSWVFTAYMLASTVTVPLYGKLGDVYGRRPLFLARDHDLPDRLRAVRRRAGHDRARRLPRDPGLGAGGLFPLALATIGVIVPPRDRGRYQGLIGATFAAASILGPRGRRLHRRQRELALDLLHQPPDRRARAARHLADDAAAARPARALDRLPGAALLASGTTALLLGLVWGGQQYPWASGARRSARSPPRRCCSPRSRSSSGAREPILPFDVLRNPIVASSVICMALVGMAMFGTIAYVPLFVQGVIGTSATSSGVVLTPLMLGAVTTSFLTGQWVSRTGRYRQNAIVGPVVLTIGMLLLWRMDVHTTTRRGRRRNMVVAGIGIGSMMQVFVLSVQNSVSGRTWAPATALTQFSRSIGATIGVTVMGVIVNQGLPPASTGAGQPCTACRPRGGSRSRTLSTPPSWRPPPPQRPSGWWRSSGSRKCRSRAGSRMPWSLPSWSPPARRLESGARIPATCVGVRRWLFLPLLVLVGLLFALPGAAAVRTDNAKVAIGVVDGQYRLNVENTGDGQLTQFTFTPASTLHVATLVSSSSGSCQLAGAGFTCSVDLNPPPCMCNPGGNVTVAFTGTGESTGSTVTVGMTTITATGGGSIAAPATTPPVVTPPTTTPPKDAAEGGAEAKGKGAVLQEGPEEHQEEALPQAPALASPPMAEDFMPLDGWDHVELWVGNAKQAAFYYEQAFGFTKTAYAGPETGVRDRASYVLEQGDVRLVVTSGLREDSEIARFAGKHGDGAKDIALRVPDAKEAYRQTVQRGARGVVEPHWVEDEFGRVELATIGTYGDVVHTFVNRSGYDGAYLPGYVAQFRRPERLGATVSAC